MTVAPTARDGSSISARRRSASSRPSARGWQRFGSPGRRSPAGTGTPGATVTGPAPASLPPTALRALARRHGITPKKSLGQSFLVDTALARRIAQLAEAGPGERVLEIGAGLGSLTLPLAATGASVTALEIDRRLIPALTEVTAGWPDVRVVQADAMRISWATLLEGEPWALVANLPYNVATPVVMRILEEEPRVRRILVMVQREAGERLAARPGTEHFGAVSLRVAYRARASVVRRVPASVFWPVPNVESVLVRVERLDAPPVDASERSLFELIDEAFAQRRKTMRNALVRLGVPADAAAATLERSGLDPRVRPEELSLEAFARV